MKYSVLAGVLTMLLMSFLDKIMVQPHVDEFLEY